MLHVYKEIGRSDMATFDYCLSCLPTSSQWCKSPRHPPILLHIGSLSHHISPLGSSSPIWTLRARLITYTCYFVLSPLLSCDIFLLLLIVGPLEVENIGYSSKNTLCSLEHTMDSWCVSVQRHRQDTQVRAGWREWPACICFWAKI